ncbi:hypothetical protein GT755_38145 [Herbidospora sp. NEAU-GS84]|uniref:Uncharacterized protein n=1 Tax=Herbidospora solisilvae TaxID=2696284 RepID=A0A7C9NTH9_9ACTN|nr:hypothetical protein [Herbidospora solisilvae]NAS27476.1 hypothetical protein [Herbidospora solisilvae]
MTTSPTPAAQARQCPVCRASITAATTGRPARYCGTPCRQAAHRARRRAAEAARAVDWTRQRLAADLDRIRQLTDKLAAAGTAALESAALNEDSVDGQALPGIATGWETGLADLARHAARVLHGIESAAREHGRHVADYRHAARQGGLTDPESQS